MNNSGFVNTVNSPLATNPPTPSLPMENVGFRLPGHTLMKEGISERMKPIVYIVLAQT